MFAAENQVAARPGRGALLAAVADYHPAGDSVALHYFPHASAQLPYVSATTCWLAQQAKH